MRCIVVFYAEFREGHSASFGLFSVRRKELRMQGHFIVTLYLGIISQMGGCSPSKNIWHRRKE
jgi:hypothetical protein